MPSILPPSECFVVFQSTTVTVTAPAGFAFRVRYAYWGHPTGYCDTGYFPSPTCDTPTPATSVIQGLCDGKSTCTIDVANANFGIAGPSCRGPLYLYTVYDFQFARTLQPTSPPTVTPTRRPTSPSQTPVTNAPSSRKPINLTPTEKPTFLPSAPTSNPLTPTYAPSYIPTVCIQYASSLFPTNPGALAASDHSIVSGLWCQTAPTVFDGSTTFLRVPSLSPAVGSQLSISMWITTTDTSGVIMSLGRDPTNIDGYFAFRLSNGYLEFFDTSVATGIGFNNIVSTVAVNTGSRLHVAFVKNGDSGTFYVSGQPAGTGTGSVVTYKNQNLIVGANYRNYPTLSNQLLGTIDNVCLYDFAISVSQVTYLALDPTCWTVYSGQDRSLGDIGACVSVDTVQDCKSSCLTTPGCLGFTVAYASLQCCLKSTLNTLTPNPQATVYDHIC